ncbi:DUF3558 domain-containing protein [Streptomyces sp. NPDC058417]|uniref:DUF3558 domain-containing protein n=1 Tax=unclassified Streptomyces TaxID=2593676 RepID=UPI00365DB03B
MQRRAPRDDRRDQRTQRAGGLGRALVAMAAVPVMLVAAGCSSDSGSGSDGGSGTPDAAARQDGGASTGSAPSAAPTVQAAAYATLPEGCGVLAKKTLTELVPKASGKGKEGTSSDTAARASCSWSSLDNNGVKGSQFRWLNVSLVRFESDAASSGEQQAREYFGKQVQDALAATGATAVKSAPLAATGDQATTVRYDLKKKEGAFKQQTVVSRVENVVVSVDYNGAGLAGDKTPDADALVKAAEKAAKETVAAVRAANGEADGTGSKAPAPAPTGSAAPSATALSASPKASKAATEARAKAPSKVAGGSDAKTGSTGSRTTAKSR